MESGPFVVFLMSLVPFPLCYILNTQEWMREPSVILVAGVVVLTLVLLIPYLAIRRMKKPDSILYVMGLFMFSCTIDLIIALEGDGIISEFMTFYLKEGEPYLWTSYGTLLNYWDGIVHYGLCLWILYRVSFRRSYRKVGLFWAGSFINSVIVLLIGTVIGKFGLRLAILLNVPYVVVPLWITFRLLTTKDNSSTVQATKEDTCVIWRRPVDMFFIVYFLFAVTIDFFRGFIALGSQEALLQEFLEDHEPYIMHPWGYSKAQMVVNMMYCIPYYACAIYGLLNPGQQWLSDWSLLFAGAAAQGQFVHIGGSIHPRTDVQFVVPSRPHSRQIFWLVNIALFMGPQLFALKSNLSRNGSVSNSKRLRKEK